VFAVQDEITDAIVATIEPQIYAAESFRARRKPPNSLDAWDLVMRALSHYWRVTQQDHLAAQLLLQQAIAIDPNYGQALSVLATSHMFGVHLGWADIVEAAPLAERAALAAILADSEDAWAHTALGSVCFSTRRLDDSLAEFELALQLNPNFSLAQGYYALALSYGGRWHDSYEAAQRAIRLSPRDPSLAIYYGIAAYAQFVGRNYSEAMALSREAIRQRGDLTGAYRVLTVAAGMAGQTEVSVARCRSCAACNPTSRLPGSQTSCRGSSIPTASTTSKASAAPASSSRRLRFAPFGLQGRGPGGNRTCDLSSLPVLPPASAGPPPGCCWIADSACSAASASRPTLNASQANSVSISPRCCSMSPTRPRCSPLPARFAPRWTAKRSPGWSTMPALRSRARCSDCRPTNSVASWTSTSWGR